jgi:iron(III) transport system substrate-binding protein
MLDELHDWAINQYEASDGRTVGIYAGALGFGYNTELLAEKGLEPPACWADLIKPEFQGEVQIANPNSSGTAYTALATFVQLMGEEEAFEYLQALHANVNQYTKSGSAPIKAAAQGETMIGIVFQHDAVTQKVAGFPIEVVSPCEGTGYEIGSMSIIKGARNPESARTFYDFVLRADIQSMAADVGAYQVPSNKNAEAPPEAPDFSEINLIDYDFKEFGSSDTRARLLARWDAEVGSLPN